jgi:hypothetical protein
MEILEFTLYAMTILCISGIVFYSLRSLILQREIATLKKMYHDTLLKINQMKNMIGEYPENPEALVSQVASNVPFADIMQQFGIDPGILKNPLVKGLVDRYAPKILEQMTKGGLQKQEGVTGELRI